MLHVPSVWDVDRSRKTPLDYCVISNEPQRAIFILVRCRLVVHLGSASRHRHFRRAFCVRTHFAIIQVRRAQAGGVALSGRRQRSRTLRVASIEPAVEHSY